MICENPLIRSRTTPIPRSSEAFNSKTSFREFSPISWRAMHNATVLFPVPGGPANSRCGIVAGVFRSAFNPSTVSVWFTTSSSVFGRYFSIHISPTSLNLHALTRISFGFPVRRKSTCVIQKHWPMVIIGNCVESPSMFTFIYHWERVNPSSGNLD